MNFDALKTEGVIKKNKIFMHIVIEFDTPRILDSMDMDALEDVIGNEIIINNFKYKLCSDY